MNHPKIIIKEWEIIGQLLVQKGLIKINQLEQALKEQEKTGGLLGTILVRLGFIEREDLFAVLSEQFGTEYVKLKDVRIPHSTIDSIPDSMTHSTNEPIIIYSNKIKS